LKKKGGGLSWPLNRRKKKEEKKDAPAKLERTLRKGKKEEGKKGGMKPTPLRLGNVVHFWSPRGGEREGEGESVFKPR